MSTNVDDQDEDEDFEHLDHKIMTTYERFVNDGNTSDNTGDDVSIHVDDGDELMDKQVQINKVNQRSGSFTVYNTDTTDDTKVYIDDPAGNPFAPKSTYESLKEAVSSVVENLIFRAVTVLLILLDFILVIIDLARNSCATIDNGLDITSHIIICFFFLEVSARIFCQGRQFFSSILDILDMAVVFISFIIDMVFIGIEADNSCQESDNVDYAKLVVIGRVVRIIRIARIVYLMVLQKRQVTRATRKIISQNKRRYRKDGFDLDLCYITERIIAMSFPSKGVMAFYRNPVREVARFFNTKHPNHYRIYNLCSERDYDETLFHNNVQRVLIDDHNVPTLSDMLEYTKDVRDWMAADKQNIIAVHCKGGKGRTGTMICIWLIDCGLFEEAEESLTYFGDRRTDLSVGKTFQGVETPSQSRYVGYYEKLKNDYDRQLPPKTYLKMTSVKIEAIAGVGNGDGSDLSMEIRANGLLIYSCQFGSNTNCQLIKYTDSDSIVVELQNSPRLEGDIKIMFHSTNPSLPKGYDKCPFYFWFNTAFIEDNRLYLTRQELDNPHKKKVAHIFREHFAVEVKFESVEAPAL
ncbi:phosphatidylinositol 3,4,5-trisphosphate 3-phosphatase TPTE2-like [Gigantopelta aegis]|uniref:phosphatidylinositol 3,4,5-trisphosphate 3-phosphatase TPTE2-like n=1 Tax=Gigantopelta aegis TaxID=1735272 RepID=UPI001B88D45E|nr:phosphatidylinositol 3,4,5-trisphosphate 3-phosphatase TPTE2-like [Gigantopelta aegis]